MGNRECKVDRVVNAHDLDAPGDRYEDVDEYLVARWTGADGGSSDGYRTLAEWFNRRLLETVYERRGRDVLMGAFDAEFDLLTGEESIDRAELEADLRRDGIDPESVRSDMVSFGSIRTHLTQCLDAEKPERSTGSDWERRSVDIATRQAREKASEALSALESGGEVRGGASAEISVQVQVHCPECPTRVPYETVLRRGFVCETHFPREP